MHKLHIVFVLKYFPAFGGGETITILLANKFIELSYDVSIVYFIDKIRKDLPYIDSKIKVVKLSDKKSLSTNIKLFNSYILDNKVDIIINQWGREYIRLCYESKKNTMAKLVTCFHFDPFLARRFPTVSSPKILLQVIKYLIFIFSPTKARIFASKYNSIYNKNNAIVFLSESYLKNFINKMRLQLNDPKLYSIPNALTYTSSLNEENLKNKKKHILFVGRMDNVHKRVDLILKVWSLIEKKYKSEWYLKLIGEGPDMNKLIRMAKNLSLENVSFEGFINPKSAYEQASVILMTSAFEGLPMVILEAQQMGVVPIVMDSFSSIHDIIEDGYNGIIVPNNDIIAFKNAIISLFDNPERRYVLAQKAVKSSQRFAIETIIVKWQNLFIDLLNKK
jgi:Glycosyltransferase